MEVTIGKVVDGKVVVDGAPLQEGATVAVLLRDEATFSLTPEQEAELLKSIAEADRGETIDGWDLLEQLRSRR